VVEIVRIEVIVRLCKWCVQSYNHFNPYNFYLLDVITCY